MKVNELLTLTIEDVVLGGQALARHEGRVVFVDRGLPGDRVQARLARIRRRWADARLESFEPGCPDRVAAPCPHVQRCGGCRLQDLGYEAQCRLKQRHVRETLQHLRRAKRAGLSVLTLEYTTQPEKTASARHVADREGFVLHVTDRMLGQLSLEKAAPAEPGGVATRAPVAP